MLTISSLLITGWEIAANQQISQLKLEGFHLKKEYSNYLKQPSSVVEINQPGQILMSLQEAAVNIFKQYFSDNVCPKHVDLFMVSLIKIVNALPFYYRPIPVCTLTT